MLVNSLFTFIVVGSVFSTQRHKRVIDGVALDGRPTTYTAIRYYGAITTAHSHPTIRSALFFLGKHPNVWCSGSLISPQIVQTACHCLKAHYVTGGSLLEPAVAAIHWDQIFRIYFGVSKVYGKDSWESTTPVMSRKFLVHEKCARIKGTDLITYDFGIIQIPDTWYTSDDTFPYAWTELESAPQYTAHNLLHFNSYAQIKQLVCLHIGFGGYSESNPRVKSKYLLTGWAVLTTKTHCIATLKLPEVPMDEIGETYAFSCGTEFPQHVQGSGKGDSGGPISCDNRYFATVMGHAYKYFDPYVMVNMYAPLAYNLFINAIEYRAGLMRTIDNLLLSYKDQVYDYYKETAPRKKRFETGGR